MKRKDKIIRFIMRVFIAIFILCFFLSVFSYKAEADTLNICLNGGGQSTGKSATSFYILARNFTLNNTANITNVSLWSRGIVDSPNGLIAEVRHDCAGEPCGGYFCEGQIDDGDIPGAGEYTVYFNSTCSVNGSQQYWLVSTGIGRAAQPQGRIKSGKVTGTNCTNMLALENVGATYEGGTWNTVTDGLYFILGADIGGGGDPPDTTPPSSVTNLASNGVTNESINYNWTNPGDADFNTSIIYFGGINVANTTNEYYNATGLSCNTQYNITIHTKDHTGNVNNTDVTNLTTTLACSACVINWTNTSWSTYSYDYGACLINDSRAVNRTRFLTEYDANGCNATNTTYWENSTYYESCNYCSYNITYSNWSNWTNTTLSCGNRTRYYWDLNYESCCQYTNISTDCYLDDNATFQGNYTETQTSVCSVGNCDNPDVFIAIAIILGVGIFILAYLGRKAEQAEVKNLFSMFVLYALVAFTNVAKEICDDCLLSNNLTGTVWVIELSLMLLALFMTFYMIYRLFKQISERLAQR